MTNEKILEGNALIAKFMNTYQPYSGKYTGQDSIISIGITNYTQNDGCDYVTDGAIIRVSYKLEDLLYYSSLDWLMPVVEKIELSMSCLFGYFEGAYFIKNEDDYPFINEIGNSKIESIWLTVVETIKYYNNEQINKN
jgi:hypothetical protein